MDEVLAALNAPQITEMLEITNDDFLLARSDSNLFETMRITYELLLALRDSGVLDTFFRLPAANRKDFSVGSRRQLIRSCEVTERRRLSPRLGSLRWGNAAGHDHLG